MSNRRSPGRDGYPMSLKPLTPEQALRKAMSVPAPKDEPKATKRAKGKRKAGKTQK